MNKKVILGSGIIVSTLAIAYYLMRRAGFLSISSAISSAMGNYFTVNELCLSDVAKARGIDNTPSASVKSNLEKLIVKLLNPIREKYGKPIRISSGYRCLELNTAVHGKSNSQHLTGQAADLLPVSGGSLADIFRSAVAVGGYDQLIIENANGAKWVHVSYSDSPRGQMLYYNGTYTTISKSNYENYL